MAALGASAALVAVLLFPMHHARAAQLSEPQIQAILNLLTSFYVPEATVKNVGDILHRAPSVTIVKVVFNSTRELLFTYSRFPSSFGAELIGASDGKVYQNGLDSTISVTGEGSAWMPLSTVPNGYYILRFYQKGGDEITRTAPFYIDTTLPQ
jgi:hypothetical protein